MIKFFLIISILLFLFGCTNDQNKIANVKSEDINSIQNLTFEQFKKIIIIYSEQSDFPDINN